MDEIVLAQFLTKIDVNQEKDDLTEEQILFMIAKGILDSSPTIVSRALAAVRSILTVSGELVNKFILEVNKLANVDKNPMTKNTLFNFLLARCEDERVNSRKAALSALEALYILVEDHTLLDTCLDKLQLRCRDHSLTIRKQAAESLTRILLKFPGIDVIEQTWLRAVMAMIVDREVGVQQFCAKLIAEVLITPLANDSECNAWRLLNLIEQQMELRRLLLRVLVFMHNEKNLSIRFVNVLERNAHKLEHSNAAWMLLSEISAFTQVDINDAVSFWNNPPTLGDVQNRVIQYVSKVLSNGSQLLTDTQRSKLKRQLSDALYHYRLSTAHIPAVYYAFAKICNAIGDNADGKFVLQKFNEEWFNNSLKELDNIIYEKPATNVPIVVLDANESINGKVKVESDLMDTDASTNDTVNCEVKSERNEDGCNSQGTIGTHVTTSHGEIAIKSEKLERVIFCIGECLQYTPNLLCRSLFQVLKVIIASDKLKEINASTGPTPRPFTPDDKVFGNSQTTNIRFSQTTDNGVHYETGRETPAMMVKGRVVCHEFLTRKVRAEGVLTLGKLCLLDERLAKKCVPVFVRELRLNNDYIIRNNIVVVVCDLCIRYTLLVDRYSAILASCLNDSSVLVRQQTLMLLTNLIKEQFLKWEGSIIYRFVTTLLDSQKQIREYAEFCLVDILLPQFPMMFFNHFLECLFYFNQVIHQSWIGTVDKDVIQENSYFSLAGEQKSSKRMVLYKFMMKTFTDDQKYKVCERIACEVFAVIRGDSTTGSLSDDKENVYGQDMRLRNPNVVNLLKDSFKIMRSQEIKLSLQVGQRPVDDQADEDDPSEERTKAAKKLIAKVFGDKIVDATVPHLLQLREFLIENCSPLAHECFAVIIELYKDYQQNFDDIFASDPLIKAEIEFQLKQERQLSTHPSA